MINRLLRSINSVISIYWYSANCREFADNRQLPAIVLTGRLLTKQVWQSERHQALLLGLSAAQRRQRVQTAPVAAAQRRQGVEASAQRGQRVLCAARLRIQAAAERVEAAAQERRQRVLPAARLLALLLLVHQVAELAEGPEAAQLEWHLLLAALLLAERKSTLGAQAELEGVSAAAKRLVGPLPVDPLLREASAAETLLGHTHLVSAGAELVASAAHVAEVLSAASAAAATHVAEVLAAAVLAADVLASAGTAHVAEVLAALVATAAAELVPEPLIGT